MPRHILTLLALLSGFLAYGEPARAAELADLTSQLEQGEKAGDPEHALACRCQTGQLSQRSLGIETLRCATAEPLRIFIPTIRFGSDRAYE